MTESIADYAVLRGSAGGRYVAQPPARIGYAGAVLVREMTVDAAGWEPLCDDLARIARLRAAGLLRPIEVGFDPDARRAFLVTELAERVAGPGSVAGAAIEVAGVARALHSLHEIGLAYGPVAPAALLRAERGPVLDLPRLDAAPGEIVAEATIEWISAADPEVLAGEPPSRHSDIWTLGALLHSLSSRQPLYPGIEAEETVTALQRVLFTRPVLDASLPAAIGSLIQRCVSPDRADRPPSARWLAEHLEAVDLGRSGT